MKIRKESRSKIPFLVTPILLLGLVFSFTSQALAGVNLEVPLEMIDRGISSHNTATRTHKRSSIYFNKAEYDGDTVSCYFEIVANNLNTTTAYNVYLRDMTNASDRVTVPVGAGAVRVRYRFPFTPVDNNNNEYRMKIQATPAAADQIQVFAARIIVVQTNATKTRIQIPLLNHGFNGSYNGTGAATDTVTLTTYSQNSELRFSLWKKDASAWGDLAATNPWTFEAVTRVNPSGTSYVSLFNKTDNTQVTDTEVSTTGTGMTLLSRDFIDSATNFHDIDDFEVRHRHSTGGTIESRLGRAALYVRLTNLNRGEVYWRFGRKNEKDGNATNNQQRVMLTTDNYSNPQVYHESTGWESVSGVVSSEVFDAGTTDTGTTGSVISSSTIEFDSTSKVRKRNATDLMPVMTSGIRYIRQITRTSGTIVVASNWLVVTFSSGGCTSPGTPTDPSPADAVTNVSIDADLSWTCTGADSYDVYFGESSNPPFVGTTADTTYTLPTNEYCTKYYWKIRAKNVAGGGCTTTGDIWDFTTENGPPGAPSSPDPFDGETGVSKNAVLDWSDCTGTDTYEVYLDKDVNPPTTMVIETAGSTYDPNLDWGSTYYWKIVAKNSCGSSTAGDVWTFATGAAPAADHFVWDTSPSPGTPYDSWDTAAHTIQQAINATTGSTIMVRAGTTYNERFTMKDGVDLVAEEGVKPTIIMQPLSYLHGVVQFTGPMTGSLTGFNISRGTGTTGTMGSLILVDGTNGLVTANITDCTMGDARGYGAGIRLVGTVDTTITDCDIYRSAGGGLRLGIGTSPFGALMDRIESGSSITIKGTTVGGAGLGLNTSGIRLMGSGSNIQVRIGGNGVDEGNMISHSSYGGIVLSGIDQVSIENNDVSNNGAFAGAAGILLVDANTVSPHVKNNSIHHQASGAGINIGGASNVTIEGSNDIYANYTGIVFYVKNNTTWDTYMMDKIPQTASSGTVTISGNNIFGNSYAGIAIRDGITGTVNIEDNDIYSNIRGGMRIQRKCNLNILRNTIRDNNRGGIHTGKDTVDGGGFGSTLGTAVLTIEKNKLYSNGSGGYGAGIDVRHASGTMYNNLVYNNYKGGIRFGDYITEIINNTVVGNGNAAGGGIVYDDLAGAVNDPAAGVPSAPLLIRNNISAYNVSAGIRACFTNTLGSEERDYNLVYSNNGQGETTCGWPGTINRRCANKQFGGCGHLWSPRGLDGPNNIIADPLFESIVEGSEDYHLKAGSPAENAGDDNLDMGAYGGSDPFVD